MGVSGGYGAADLGMNVGREYPLSVLVRKLAYKDPALAREFCNVAHHGPGTKSTAAN